MCGSMIPSWYIDSVYLLMACARGSVGSVSTLSYMVSSERWSRPSLVYCSVSSTTMPEPLSAFLMTKVWSVYSSLRPFLCVGVKLGVVFKGLIVLISLLILFRYVSISGEAEGGSQELFPLKGCRFVGGLFLKKYFSLLLLSKQSRESISCVGG